MRGDPKEFPFEIRALTGKSCNLILFPWRESHYVERLFWGSINAVTAPIALIVMIDTDLTPTIADIASGSGYVADNKEARKRSQSLLIARSRAFSCASDPEGGSTTLHIGERRGRAESSAASRNVPSSPPCSPAPSAVQGSLMRLLSGHDLTLDDSITAPQHPTVETARTSVSIHTMLCVISNLAVCSTIFPLALRFAQRQSVQITVIVTSDIADFPDNLQEILSAFRNLTETVNNIKIDFLQTPSRDVEAIMTQCAANIYDLIVVGFSESWNSTVGRTDDVGDETVGDVIPPSAASHRSHRTPSISFGAPVIDNAGASYNISAIILPFYLLFICSFLIFYFLFFNLIYRQFYV